MASIEDKLQVLAFLDTLEKEKNRAQEILCAPVKIVGESKEAQASRREALKWAKEVRRRNNYSECKRKFPLTVGGAQICKWRATAQKEAWHQLPVAVRSRICATGNKRRAQLQLPLKGKKQGGSVPLSLQRELDMLIAEHAHGSSEVSERREVVTIEHVVFQMQLTWKPTSCLIQTCLVAIFG